MILAQIGSLLRTFVLAGSMGASPNDVPAPANLLSWEAEDFVAPQEGSGDSFIDFDHFEAAIRVGMLVFSEDFEGDNEIGYGLFARAPMPWLGNFKGKSETDEFFDGYVGIWMEFIVSSLDRDITPALETPDDTVFFIGAGLDYAIYRDDTWQWLFKMGLQYGNFGDITDTHDGVALTVGFTLGVQVISGLWITYTPEIAIAEAGDHIIFNHLGVLYAF